MKQIREVSIVFRILLTSLQWSMAEQDLARADTSLANEQNGALQSSTNFHRHHSSTARESSRNYFDYIPLLPYVSLCYSLLNMVVAFMITFLIVLVHFKQTCVRYFFKIISKYEE